jgi:hypothetical protein
LKEIYSDRLDLFGKVAHPQTLAPGANRFMALNSRWHPDSPTLSRPIAQ